MKYVIFKEMLDYVAHICNVTDADMNYCGDTIHIEGETEEQTLTINVTIKNKEVRENA